MNSRTQARREPLPNETALREAADRPKAVPDNGLAIPANVGDRHHHARRQPARRHRRVAVTGDRQR